MPHPIRYYRDPLPADLTGRHVVVEREQGLGDQIFFLRFLPRLRERGARITYLSDPRLIAMVERAGLADRVLPLDDDPGPFDLRLTLGDLPWLLGSDNAGALPPPVAIPPLADRTARLGERLRAFGPPPHVGLTWRAGSTGADFLSKQAPLDRLAGAIRPLGARPVAVQRLPQSGEVAALEAAVGAPVLDLTALNGDIEDMLALMGLLDLYVCVSNTNHHLRTATGRTSHVLVPAPPEYRWMATGTESPWFPGTGVYRQAADGDWSSALAALEAGLTA